jgi:hypothetical protein
MEDRRDRQLASTGRVRVSSAQAACHSILRNRAAKLAARLPTPFDMDQTRPLKIKAGSLVLIKPASWARCDADNVAAEIAW